MNREQWLEARRNLVTASDAAAILGLDSRRDALEVYCGKLGIADDEDNAAMEFGREAEELVARGYAKLSGRRAWNPCQPGEYRILIHPEHPWLGASIDRLTTDDPCGVHVCVPLECKVQHYVRRDEWEPEPPMEYQCQLQIQIAVMGVGSGVLAAAFGWPPRPHFAVCRADPEFFDLAVPKLLAFHEAVKNRIPPEPRSSDALPALRRLYGTGNGETIELDQAGQALVVEWERALEASDSASEWASECRARLLGLMAGASWAKLPDGSTLVQKKHGNGLTLKREWWRRR